MTDIRLCNASSGVIELFPNILISPIYRGIKRFTAERTSNVGALRNVREEGASRCWWILTWTCAGACETRERPHRQPSAIMRAIIIVTTSAG